MRPNEKEHFDNIASKQDSLFSFYLKPAGKLRIARRLSMFKDYCQILESSRVLEIGCGTGEYTLGLSSYGCRFFSTDISYNMLNRVSAKLPLRDHASLFVSDIDFLPVKDECFDVVVGVSILHHLADIEKSASTLFRVLRKNGKLAFSEPNMLNPQVFLQKNIKFLKKISGDSPGETAFFRWKIKKIFENAGFKNVSAKSFDFVHPHTPDILLGITEKTGLILERAPLIKEISGSLFITADKIN